MECKYGLEESIFKDYIKVGLTVELNNLTKPLNVIVRFRHYIDKMSLTFLFRKQSN
jgi:hypothetical protein